jgi:hypothetical protein
LKAAVAAQVAAQFANAPPLANCAPWAIWEAALGALPKTQIAYNTILENFDFRLPKNDLKKIQVQSTSTKVGRKLLDKRQVCTHPMSHVVGKSCFFFFFNQGKKSPPASTSN